MKTTETAIIIARRPDGSTFSMSLNDGDNCGRTLEERRARLERGVKRAGDTIVDVQCIVTELPPRKRMVRDRTVVVTAKRPTPGGHVLTFSRSDEELKGTALEWAGARGWADENWSPAAAQSKGYVVLSRVEFDAEYEVEEE